MPPTARWHRISSARSYDKGEFVEKTNEQYYDEEAHTFLADRYIMANAPLRQP